MREIKFKYEPITKYKDLYSTRYRFRFENGYGASVVRGIGTYGGEEGLWELVKLISLHYRKNSYKKHIYKTTP